MKSKNRILLIVCIITGSVINATAQYFPFYENKISTNALQMMNLKGKVKSVRQRSYFVMDSAGTVVKGRKDTTIYCNVNSDFYIQFDDSARAVKEIYYSGAALQGDILVHTFSKNTEVVEESTRTGKMYYRYTYKYGAGGKMTEMYQSQIFKDNTSYNYKTVFKLDAKGNRLEKKLYETNDKPELLGKCIYEYDGKGNLILINGSDAKGGLSYKESLKTDEKGCVVEHDYYNGDLTKIEHSFALKYDAYQNVIEKKYFKPGGKLVTVYSSIYKYDTKGNWIRRTDYENKKGVRIVERVLEYY